MKEALFATGFGALKGLGSVGLGRNIGNGSLGEIGKRIWKAKSIKKGVKQVSHNVKASFKCVKKLERSFEKFSISKIL